MVAIKLRTEIHRMDPRIVAFDDQVVPGAQEYVELLDDFALERGARDAQPLGRGPDDGPGFQQDDPVVLDGIVRVHRDQVTRHFSSEHAHCRPRSARCDRPTRVATPAARSIDRADARYRGVSNRNILPGNDLAPCATGDAIVWRFQ